MATPEATSTSSRPRLLFGALAVASAGVLTVALAVAGQAGSGESTLPTLPPVDEREPEVYDDDGCVDLGPDLPRDCGTTAGQLDAVLAGPPGDEFRTLAGFVGPRWTTELHRDEVLVLEDTVQTSSSGTWRAQGLVRNETGSPVDGVVVQATLRDGDGAEVDVIDAAVAVAPVRPGEPAPFSLEADVDAGAAASVEWSVRSVPTEAAAAPRAAEVVTYWTEPVGERSPPISIADHVDPTGGVAPHLVFGSVTGIEGALIESPIVVAAWFDADGKVLATTRADVVGLGGADALDRLRADDLGDFVLVVDAVGAQALDSAELARWVSGS